MDAVELMVQVNKVLSIIFILLYFYQLVFIFVPLFKKYKHKNEPKPHKFAILISARNEAAVIGHLINSISQQNYPQDLITTFVVADNCTDDTAKIARDAGAVVYERFNKEQVGKGFALNYLSDRIREDYGTEAFDGFFVFDADNLLDKDYVAEMNKTFSDGYNVITSYRNSKNYGDNWISAGYGLWFLREAMYLNRSRALTKNSCALSGTGFLFSNEIMNRAGGWNFFLLTEDAEFTVYNVLNGEKIGFCETAVFYDEQPVTLSQSWRQRLRWSKGYFQVFGKYGGDLFKGVLKGKGFSYYDMCMTVMPAAFLLSVFAILFNTSMVIYSMLFLNEPSVVYFSIMILIRNIYSWIFLVGAITTITQWKNIKTTAFKKILYTFTFPIFMFTYIPISCQALFSKVEWKPIKHDVSISIDQMKVQ